MYQGETITTTITGFPVPISEIADLRIVFRNQFETLLEKTLTDCTISDEAFNALSFEITQTESLLLGRGTIERSAVIITKDGSRMESCPSYIVCAPTIKKEVL